MGAAGDMLMGALWEAAGSDSAFLHKLNAAGIPGLLAKAERTESCGIFGTHMIIEIDGKEETEHHHHHEHEHHDGGHHHHYHGLSDITGLIESLNVSGKVKEDAVNIYRLIADAESRVHGTDMEHIHFHEVGSLDAVADVTGCCMLMEKIGADRVAVSPVNVGSGKVRCAHGILPVPAPATELLLRGIPYYSGKVNSELCTPTGAAVLRYFGDDFGDMPEMKVISAGYGIGTKEFGDNANCVRAFIGESPEGETLGTESLEAECSGYDDEVYELMVNLDDMTGEEIGFVMEKLLDEGALDVYIQPITMKKSRPAVKLCCLCRPEDRKLMAELIFKHTSTIGIREQRLGRYTLKREAVKAEISGIEAAAKVSCGYGVRKIKPEFESARALAEKDGITIKEAGEIIIKALAEQGEQTK